MTERDDARGAPSLAAVKAAGRRDPLVGTTINGKFRVLKSIARGGMGRIYYGTQSPLDRPVALKVVKADSVHDDDSRFLDRFLLEASILAKLQHPNVVTLFDYGRIEDIPVEMYFIAMEYLDGETLTERLRSAGALPTSAVLQIVRQIARGLREAHGRGVIHRDLKPSNIVLVPEADGEIVKLVDFGIGKVERAGEDLTREGVLVGTPKYMAPEQFDGEASPASDVFALGTIAYQCLTGVVPFGGQTTTDFMLAKLQQPIPPMQELNPLCDAPEVLEDLVRGMLARDPRERPRLDDLFERLALCDEEVFGTGSRTLGPGAGFGFPRGARHLSVSALSTTPTIVAPHPRAEPPSGPTTVMSAVAPSSLPLLDGRLPSSPPLITGVTPRPTWTESPRVMPSSSAAGTVALAGVFALALLGAFMLWLTKRPAPAPPMTTTALSVPGDAGSTFVLHLESTPPGALVTTEDGQIVGSTPADIVLDRAAVRSSPRTLQVKKDGFATVILVQGAFEGALVEKSVSLAAEASSRPVSKPHGLGRSPATTSRPVTPGPPQGESDIRTRR